MAGRMRQFVKVGRVVTFGRVEQTLGRHVHCVDWRSVIGPRPFGRHSGIVRHVGQNRFGLLDRVELVLRLKLAHLRESLVV